MAATKEKFDAAVKVIQSIPPNGSFVPSQSMMLKFYAYYKQATEGPCNIPRPSFWEVIAKAKWDAWNGLSDMPPHEAMANYVEELKKIIEAMPHTEHVQGFVEKLGDFYEAIDELPPGFDKKPKYWMNSNGDLPKVTEVDVNGSSDSGIDGEELGEILSAGELH
ncbi:hypothetical protein CAPTEDRAFT_125310 [Capitella teleta]|uniref:ACB domain-containing protein n=1 Tax=Capitella teleta TaxID=283909 RepID=R7TC32_CAPTE|nr:hypothetical protein CAPTEDRAFT_125310 [Capitella teleta]|eukprot:ELT91062.1 hypothetical protein CAPTEDRAFT_125310 [Capitella teleta]